MHFNIHFWHQATGSRAAVGLGGMEMFVHNTQTKPVRIFVLRHILPVLTAVFLIRHVRRQPHITCLFHQRNVVDGVVIFFTTNLAKLHQLFGNLFSLRVILFAQLHMHLAVAGAEVTIGFIFPFSFLQHKASLRATFFSNFITGGRPLYAAQLLQLLVG